MIQELPADTIAQFVSASVWLAEILGLNTNGVKYFICSVVFFLLCYVDESLEGPIMIVVNIT